MRRWWYYMIWVGGRRYAVRGTIVIPTGADIHTRVDMPREGCWTNYDIEHDPHPSI